MSKNEMLLLIEAKRKELIEVVQQNGINSSISIRYSQELDSLLTEYIKINHEKNEQAHLH